MTSWCALSREQALNSRDEPHEQQVRLYCTASQCCNCQGSDFRPEPDTGPCWSWHRPCTGLKAEIFGARAHTAGGCSMCFRIRVSLLGSKPSLE